MRRRQTSLAVSRARTGGAACRPMGPAPRRFWAGGYEAPWRGAPPRQLVGDVPCPRWPAVRAVAPRRFLALALCLFAGIQSAGCNSSQPGATTVVDGQKSAPQVLLAAAAALDAAGSFHAEGQVRGPNAYGYSIDARPPDAVVAKVTGNANFDYLRTGSHAYVRGADAFRRAFDDATAARAGGSWVEIDGNEAVLSFRDAFTLVEGVVSTAAVLRRYSKNAVLRGPDTVNGQRVVLVVDSSLQFDYISDTGAPLPLRLSRGTSTDFSMFGEKVSLPELSRSVSIVSVVGSDRLAAARVCNLLSDQQIAMAISGQTVTMEGQPDATVQGEAGCDWTTTDDQLVVGLVTASPEQYLRGLRDFDSRTETLTPPAGATSALWSPTVRLLAVVDGSTTFVVHIISRTRDATLREACLQLAEDVIVSLKAGT